MIPLSENTKRLAEVLFEGENRERMLRQLVEDCSENIPFMENSDAEGMERIRFAILKLCSEKPGSWEEWFELARIDWRDLFVSAGFGYDTLAHQKWRDDILGRYGRDI